jgi:hypothetical protein
MYEDYLEHKENHEHTTIEREDNNAGYNPDNCKWATYKEQNKNKRTNLELTYKNRTQCLSAWSKEKNINYTTIYERLSRGWSIKKALETPVTS